MSLWDLMMCRCGHARHRHRQEYVRLVNNIESLESTACGVEGCECRHFLLAKGQVEEKDD